MSAGCAATSGRRQGDAEVAVRTALTMGVEAARHGRELPLALLLDSCVLATPPGCSIPERASAGAAAPVGEYDACLRGLARTVYHRLGANRQQPFNILPLVLSAWHRRPNEQPAAAARGYRKMRDDKAEVAAACQLWCGPRQVDAQSWAWYQRNGKPSSDLREGLLWSVFEPEGSRRPGDWAEWFDHGAAHFFLRTINPELLPDQQRKIDLLRNRARRMESTPFTTAYEEVDPRYGPPSLAAYIPEDIDLVCHRIVNNEVLRLNSLPPTQPPPHLNIHLCWAVEAGALQREAELRKGSRRQPVASPETYTLLHGMEKECEDWEMVAEGSIAEASVLQATVGLMVDDWRWFLHALPARFSLHRGFPTERQVENLRPGQRWKDSLRQLSGGLPRREVVNLLFQGQSFVDSLSERRAWENQQLPGGRWHWWCLCLLEHDLPGFGFQPAAAAQKQGGKEGAGWTSRGWLPNVFTHALVLDPQSGSGRFCRVIHGVQQTELKPGPKRATGLRQAGVPFCLERHAALDALLDWFLR